MLKSKDKIMINETYLDRAMKILSNNIEDSTILWQEDGNPIIKIKAEEIEDCYGNFEKIVDGKNTVTIAKKGDFKILSLDKTNFSIIIGD